MLLLLRMHTDSAPRSRSPQLVFAGSRTRPLARRFSRVAVAVAPLPSSPKAAADLAPLPALSRYHVIRLTEASVASAVLVSDRSRSRATGCVGKICHKSSHHA